ncbi:MAG: thiol reductase thioredoxin [Flavobacteriaceae bacterium]|nr:MAG: thiol reductase thioredoxin [Flavobacteriaceae bacterium]
MKKIIFLLAFIIISCCVSTQNTTTVSEINATPNSKGALVGIANKHSFSIAPYKGWFTKKYSSYHPDPTVIKKLKKQLSGVTIKAFMGTWCGDSKEQTPVFYKVLAAVDFEENKVQMITVNRSKKTPENLQKGYNIIRVPTFIFYKKGIEIGRFVEYPQKTVEADFLHIVNGTGYRHSYQSN